MYDLFGVTPEQFKEAVQKSAGDEGVLRWLQEHGTAQPSKDIARFNERMLHDGPSKGTWTTSGTR